MQLGQMELAMVEKTNSSRIAYEVSRERLRTKSSQGE